MCGRYYFGDTDSYIDLSQIIASLEGKEFATGEVFPTNLCAAFKLSADGKMQPMVMQWGMKDYKGNLRIINARSETLQQKRTFSKAFITSRAVIPMSGFFEWDNRKRKVLFSFPPPKTTFALAISECYSGNEIFNFAIITTAANESVADVHERMPLIVDKNNALEWLTDLDSAQKYLQASPIAMDRRYA